jgi:hypothetical protein
MFGSINMVLAVITGEFLEITSMSFGTFFGVSLFMPVIF